MNVPKCYCLTLRQTPERTEAARQHFLEHSLDVEMVYGLHGDAAGFAPTPAERTQIGKPVLPNEVALAVNFWWLWAMAWHTGHEEVLVFEDDVGLVPDFKTRFTEAYKALPEDWEIVHLGHYRTPEALVKRINGHVSVVQYPFGSHAVLYRRSVLPYLRRTNEAIACNPVDVGVARNTLDGVKNYCLTPQLAGQRSYSGAIPSLLRQSKGNLLPLD